MVSEEEAGDSILSMLPMRNSRFEELETVVAAGAAPVVAPVAPAEPAFEADVTEPMENDRPERVPVLPRPPETGAVETPAVVWGTCWVWVPRENF